MHQGIVCLCFRLPTAASPNSSASLALFYSSGSSQKRFQLLTSGHIPLKLDTFSLISSCPAGSGGASAFHFACKNKDWTWKLLLDSDRVGSKSPPN